MDVIGTGFERGAVDATRGPISVAFRNPVIVVGTSIGLVSFVVAVVAICLNPDGASVWWWLLSAAAFLAWLLFPMFGLVYLPMRFYLATLRRAYPSSTVLPGAPAFDGPVDELIPAGSPRLPGARDRLSGYLVFDPDRVVFYSRKRRQLIPYLELPKSRVRSSAIGSVANGNGMRSSGTVLTIARENNTSVNLTLGFAPEKITSPIGSNIQLDDAARWVCDWAS